ncbi:hypothetical protein RUM44_003809 [Polyplax serrata]|uniref:Phosphatidate cytidylyltransferase, mitochondrial n=1 Tax=Polyplax serrata TaxID=468196 RepID=A0ABR1B1G8_POLSC
MTSTANLVKLPDVFKRIVSKFPSDSMTYCFAYGSGVFKQLNNQSKKNMIDFIFAVNDAEKWHRLNMEINPSHYSALRLFGSKVVAKVQTNVPSKVYFNSMIPLKDENVVIKYGVIQEDDLIADLLDWNDIYVAGRLHKPVRVVHDEMSTDLTSALHLNLQSAAHTALLLLPENFSEIEFYNAVASISYLGDFRMAIGEDKDKVNNIVVGAVEYFRELYAPIIKAMEDYVEIPSSADSVLLKEKSCIQDISPSAKHIHLNNLPRTPQRKIVQFWNRGVRNRQDTEDVLRAMAFDQDCKEVVQMILSKILNFGKKHLSLKEENRCR